jgi:hypothetical protein
MRFLTDVFLLVWLCAALSAALFVLRPSQSLAPFRTRRRALAALIAIVVGGGTLMALLGVVSQKPKPVPVVTPVAPKRALPADAEVRTHPERYLVLDGVTSYHGPDGAVLLTGGATNVSGLAIADPRLTCRMANGATGAGTVSAVVHSVIPVGHKLIFAAVNMGPAQGPWDRHSCVVSAAVVKG